MKSATLYLMALLAVTATGCVTTRSRCGGGRANSTAALAAFEGAERPPEVQAGEFWLYRNSNFAGVLWSRGDGAHLFWALKASVWQDIQSQSGQSTSVEFRGHGDIPTGFAFNTCSAVDNPNGAKSVRDYICDRNDLKTQFGDSPIIVECHTRSGPYTTEKCK